MTPLLLYSQRGESIWDPVLNAHGHTPARFETRERASWFARRLCLDLKIAIQVRAESGQVLEHWACVPSEDAGWWVARRVEQ